MEFSIFNVNVNIKRRGIKIPLQKMVLGQIPLVFPIDKKQLYKRNVIASLSKDLVKTNGYPLFLNGHDVQPCLFVNPSNWFKHEICNLI